MDPEQELESLVDEVRKMLTTVATDRTVASPELRRVLRFVTKVVQVVDQAFQDVYATLIDFKYVSLQELQSESRLRQMRKDIELLRAHDRYRDAEQICSRLHALGDQYREQIEPIIDHLQDRSAWQRIFALIDEYEGAIIRLVNETIWELEQLLTEPFDDAKATSIRSLAGTKAERIRLSLLELEALRDRVLGLSGQEGFLELTGTSRDALDQQVNVFLHQDRSVTHGHRVAASNVSGQVAVGQDISQTNTITTTSGLTVADVAKLLDEVKEAVSAENIPDTAKSRVLNQLEEAKAEAQVQQPDKNYIANTIKKATEIVKGAGGLVTATTKVGKCLTPLAEWLGKSLAWFGL